MNHIKQQYTARQIDLFNLRAIAVSRIHNLEFKLVRNAGGEYIAGTIQHNSDQDKRVIALTHSTRCDEAWASWMHQVRQEAELHNDGRLSAVG